MIRILFCDLQVFYSIMVSIPTDVESAEKLSKIVDEACLLLAEYNGRLVAEIEDRRQVARMLSDYIRQQKSLLQESEKKLEVCKLTALNSIFTLLHLHVIFVS